MMNARQVSERCRNVDGYSEVLVDVGGARYTVSRIEEAPSGVPGRRQILLVTAPVVSAPAPEAEPTPEPEIDFDFEEPEVEEEPEPKHEPKPKPKPHHGRGSRK